MRLSSRTLYHAMAVKLAMSMNIESGAERPPERPYCADIVGVGRRSSVYVSVTESITV